MYIYIYIYIVYIIFASLPLNSEAVLQVLSSSWLSHFHVVTVVGGNGGEDHPIPAVARR